MAGLDFFGGFEDSEGAGLSAEAAEKFQEQMRANAVHIAALQKAEKKQKKEEDRLIKILLKFIKKHNKPAITLLIARLLEQNVPAAVILSIILLGNKDVQDEVGVKFQLPEGMLTEEQALADYKGSKDKVLAFFSDKVLPLKIRITLDLWGKNLWQAMEAYPHKVLNTILLGSKIKESAIRLVTFIIRDYLEQEKVEGDFSKIEGFARTVLEGLIQKLRDKIEETREIDEK